MIVNDNEQTSDEPILETRPVYRADSRSEIDHPDVPAAVGAEGTISEIEGLAPGSALLVVKRGPNAGSRFLLDQPVTSAGRHPDSDIFLDNITVSRRHAEFRLRDGQFEIADHGSLNGTYVNREPVDAAALADGDEIQIGKFRLEFFTRSTKADGDTEAQDREAGHPIPPTREGRGVSTIQLVPARCGI
jgi:pSer/pThr/pTyr-binding forkhead associated (FHA) protein